MRRPGPCPPRALQREFGNIARGWRRHRWPRHRRGRERGARRDPASRRLSLRIDRALGMRRLPEDDARRISGVRLRGKPGQVALLDDAWLARRAARRRPGGRLRRALDRAGLFLLVRPLGWGTRAPCPEGLQRVRASQRDRRPALRLRACDRHGARSQAPADYPRPMPPDFRRPLPRRRAHCTTQRLPGWHFRRAAARRSFAPPAPRQRALRRRACAQDRRIQRRPTRA
mmetsp:Transcript_21729/g.55126  ORF Transcript_21729/g.55126 Transcript_21729/m.55126 type:complete len:229 (-) Transcript_21729:49-735(-)